MHTGRLTQTYFFVIIFDNYFYIQQAVLLDLESINIASWQQMFKNKPDCYKKRNAHVKRQQQRAVSIFFKSKMENVHGKFTL